MSNHTHNIELCEQLPPHFMPDFPVWSREVPKNAGFPRDSYISLLKREDGAILRLRLRAFLLKKGIVYESEKRAGTER